MKKYCIILYCILFYSCAQDKKQAKYPLSVNLNEYFSALTAIEKFNGVIYAVKNGDTIIERAYNINQNKESSTHVTINSQFDIHSISKLMAYYLILQKEQKGKLNREQTIDTFFPDFPKGNQITIQMLLEHSSGLPRNFEDLGDNAITLNSDAIIAFAKKQTLLFKPGTKKQYSNVGYELVYLIIEKISKTPFAQYVQDELFSPLGMENSGAHFYVKNTNKKNLAKNHEKDDGEIVQVDNVLDDELKTARLFSTAHDLMLFLKELQKEPYVSILKNEDNAIQKSGGSDGIRAQIYTKIPENYSFILLTNYEEIPFRKTITDFTKILEGKSYKVPKKLNRKSYPIAIETTKKYEGTYTFPDMNNLELTFKAQENGLLVFQDGEQIATLKSESYTIFFEDPAEAESFEFMEMKNGTHNVIMGWKGVDLMGTFVKK